ncbi:MAG: hypothetical protein IJJ77_08875 [Paludibacteraceae bacterium]|nr:hypothetical protein [Paludibacteraceae bacterium]
MSKRKKRMIIWLSSIALLAVLMVGGTIWYYSVDWYKVKLKREIAHSSDEELISGIRRCDTVLCSLEKEIHSDDTNPEERFVAARGYTGVSERRKIYLKELKKREKRKSRRKNNVSH